MISGCFRRVRLQCVFEWGEAVLAVLIDDLSRQVIRRVVASIRMCFRICTSLVCVKPLCQFCRS